MDLLKEALNKFRLHFHPTHGCFCCCAVCYKLEITGHREGRCDATKGTVSSVRKWCEEILCPKEEGQLWHKKQCLMGLCKECGIKNLEICPTEMEFDNSVPIKWQTFSMSPWPSRESKRATAMMMTLLAGGCGWCIWRPHLLSS